MKKKVSLLSPLNLKCIELNRDILDVCYICLDEITHEKVAVFIHLCKHHICLSCLQKISEDKTRQDLENSSTCGICRATSNKYIMRMKTFKVKKHNKTQSIYVPSKLSREIDNHPHCDSIQKMIIQGYNCFD